jgi:hypothetical protein
LRMVELLSDIFLCEPARIATGGACPHDTLYQVLQV